MDSNYDKIKKVLAEDSRPLPPDLEWDQMESGILQKMDELQLAVAQEKAAWRRKLGIVGLILALLLIPLLCLRTTLDASLENPAEASKPLANEGLAQTPVPSTRERPSTLEEEKSNAPLANVAENDLGKDATTDSSGDKTSQNNALKPLASSPKFAPDNQVMIANQQLLSYRSLTPAASADPSTPLLAAEQLLAPKSGLRQNEDKASPLEEAGIGLGSLSSLATKMFRVKREPETIILPGSPENAPSQTFASTRKVQATHRLFLMSGIALSNMGYGSTKPERHTYETPIASIHAQVNYVHTFRQNFTGLIGLQFQQLKNRLDWQKTLTDHTITLTDTIVQLRVNSFTGQQQQVRGDVELTVGAKRVVRHYNTTRLYQIPLAVGKTWAAGNWQADVLVGGTLNIQTMNQGRTLYQDELQTYQGSSTDFMANQWQVHAMLMGRLSYQLTEHIGLTTGLQFQKSLSDWSKEAEVKMRPNIINGELGLQFSF